MTTKERILHTLLFEAFALALFIPLAMLVTDGSAGTTTLLSVLLSLIAMVWNYLYNWGFDHAFGDNRLARSFLMRLGHGLGFELGMVATSLPLMMWFLNFDFLTVLMMDLGAVVFFLIYAIVFNWGYDLVRHRFTTQPAT